MQAQGYQTYYVGKLFVEYTAQNCYPPPAGWDDIDALMHPHVFTYYNPVFSLNGGAGMNYSGQYTTDVVAQKALGYLRNAVQAKAASGKPFFLQVAPVAHHDAVVIPVSAF